MSRGIVIPEMKILRYLKAGYSYRNIAGRLGISLGSISRIAKKYGIITVTKESLEGYIWEFACKKYILENYPLSDIKFHNYMFEKEQDKWKRYIPDAYIISKKKIIEFKINCGLREKIIKKIIHYLRLANKVEFWFRYGKFPKEINSIRNKILELKNQYPKRIIFRDMSKEIRI